jgi:signal transduction histidine kinase
MGYARDYANAQHLQVRLDMSTNQIKIQVKDNGRGFDAEAMFSDEETPQDARAQGLITLKEKFELVNGSMSVISSETEGTLVRLEIPAEV